jgi:hypothetical protein
MSRKIGRAPLSGLVLSVKGQGSREREVRTEDELLHGGEHVDAVGDFELIDLQLHPLAEGLESAGHGGRVWVGLSGRWW